MKIRNIILSLIALLTVCSCKDMFEPAMENNRGEDAMIEEADYAHGLLLDGYQLLPYQTTSVTDIATDDAVTNDKNSGFVQMALGTWTASNNPMSQWNDRKIAIQYINLFLTKVDQVKWAPSSASKQQMYIDRLRGEAFGLRALQYYYLLMAHGGYGDDGVLYGVPLLTEPENASSDFNQPRATFADCMKQIIADCDSAIALLPTDYVSINLGEEDKIPAKYLALGAEYSGYNLVFGYKSNLRISGRIAEAIKAQAALLAASPAFRDGSGVTSEQAANYAAVVLDRIDGISGMDPKGNIWYANAKTIDNQSVELQETLWRENRGSVGYDLETENFPPSLYGRGRINPSQNFVDAFPMKNGYPITDPQSGYDPQKPYDNRDPRLSDYVIVNESKWKTKSIVTGTYLESDDNLNALNTSTRTGYYLKKLMREDCNPNPSAPLGQFHTRMRIRYTEIFLAYAEAANDAWGPTGTGSHGYSAYDVIQAIRMRAGIGKNPIGQYEGDPYLEACASDKAKMAELIRNERRIELSFENKRFWDLRRWKMPLGETVMGVQIDKDANGTLVYNKITVEERKFDDSYMWYGPLPQTEVLKWSNLVQNKGWR